MEFSSGSGLAAGLADRAAGWRFVADFAREWAEPLKEGDGYGPDELDAAEARLGVALPKPLREAYRLFGRRDDLTRNHDRLLRPDELGLDAAGEALVFREENQAVLLWGVLVSDLGLDDPPVYVKTDMADKTQERWDGWMGRLSHALIEMVLAESLVEPEELTDYLEVGDKEQLVTLEREYERLPFEDYPVGATDGGSRWFAGHDVLVREDVGEFLLVRARTEEALDAFTDRFPGDWLQA